MYGYSSSDEIIGKHFFIIQKAEDVEAAKEFVDGIMRGDSKYMIGEFSRKTKDGNIGYHTFSAKPVFHLEEVIGIEGFIIDTTERKQAEEALRKSERELRIRNEINIIFLTNPEEDMYVEILKVILKVNGSEYGTFGYIDNDGSFVAPAVTRNIYWDECNVPEKDILFRKGTFGGIFGQAIKERKILISNEGPFKVPEGHIHIVNTMVTPIIFRDEVISAIHIANKPDGYGEEDLIMLKTIADNIAPVLYARLQRDKLR
jgi:PAS domain S-box-containing protein